MNYFTAGFPKIPDTEELKTYPHPYHSGLSCNQLGVLTYPEENFMTGTLPKFGLVLFALDENNKKAYAGSVVKILYECYNNVRLPKSYKSIRFLNGNSLDVRQENLLFGVQPPLTEYTCITNNCNFQWNSLQYLLDMEKRFEKRGLIPEVLQDLLGLPKWLKTLRREAEIKDLEIFFRKKRVAAYNKLKAQLSPSDFELLDLKRP
jgi:hypothetical protein